MEITVKIIYGTNAGQTYRFNQEVIKIGRSKQNHLPIEDNTVSGFHSTVTFKDSKFIIVDHSKNGTFINGKKIKEAVLNNGDEIQIGLTKLQVLFETQPAVINKVIEEKTEIKRIDATERRKFVPVSEHKKKIKVRPIMIVIPAVIVILGLIYLLSSPASEPSKPPSSQKQEDKKIVGELVDIADVYKKLDVNNLTGDVKNKIIYGKEKYDGKKRVGNLYEAIASWKEALVMLDGERMRLLEGMIYTAEQELKTEIERLKNDAIILSRAGDKKGAALKLQEIIQMIPDLDDSNYRWANEKLVAGGFQKYLGE